MLCSNDKRVANAYSFFMTTFDMRKRNLSVLVRRYGRQQALADAVGLSVQYINQMLSGHRTIGEKTARKIEKGLCLVPGWMDADSDSDSDTAALGDMVKVAANDDVVEVSRESLALLRMIDSLPEKEQAILQALVDSLVQPKTCETEVVKKAR